jgi:hypothetical protein
MNQRGQPSVLNDRILSTFPSASNTLLVDHCKALLHQQLSSWPQLIEGYAGLKSARVREIDCDGDSVFVQFNPRRIVSSGAKVDPKSISERKCFLCMGNLVPEQKGVLYQDAFTILCNPFPIVDQHLTIPHVNHTRQRIEGFVPVFLDLAREMSPAFTLFYNGPKSGASAPDHMHFQACPAGATPIERLAATSPRREMRKLRNGVAFSSLKYVDRNVILAESNNKGQLEKFFDEMLSSMKRVLHIDEEPMVNVFCSYHAGSWRMIVFVRRKHRPDIFFKEGDEKMLISPAALDVGGVIVTPIERDFNRLDAKLIRSIYDEVLLDNKTVERIIAEL